MFRKCSKFVFLLASWSLCSIAVKAQNVEDAISSNATVISTTNVTSNAAVIHGVNISGTVRVNCLANLEALLNILSNGVELTFISVGSYLFIKTMLRPCSRELKIRKIIISSSLFAFGWAFPGILNWLVATARDLNLFS